MARVMVVESEPELLRTLRIALTADGYEVIAAADGAGALETAARDLPDLVVLDLGLPDMDGTDVIAGLRTWTKTPILATSGRAGAADMVDAFDAGADDYLSKPFPTQILTAKLRALRRRTETEADEPAVLIGHFSIDLAAKTVIRRPEVPVELAPATIRLTRKEWTLLEVLVRSPGRLVPGELLMRQLWGPSEESKTHHLRFHVSKLRQKLEPDPSHPRQLLTEPGAGYRFQP